MNITRSSVVGGGFALALAAMANAQDSPASRSLTLSDSESSPHRFGFSYRAGFNMDARFRNLGSGAGANPGSVASGAPHTYDDGFVLVDVSGNAGGQTWNWGYHNSSQIRGDQLVFSASNPGRIPGDGNGGIQHGFELTYACQIGERGMVRWGIESGFGYTDLSLRDRSVPGSGVLTVDTYSLDGIISPLAPYSGTFDGPGPLISDTPTRLPVNVSSRIEGSLYGLRLGPYVEIPLCKCADVILSGGPVVAVVDSEFSYKQTAAIPPTTASVSSAHDSRSEIMFGGYLAGTLNARLTESLGAFVGVQFQSLGSISQRAGDKRATLDLGQSIFLSGGLSFSF